MAATSQGTKGCWQPGERHRTESPSEPVDGTNPADALTSGPKLLLYATQFVAICQRSPRKLMHVTSI